MALPSAIGRYEVVARLATGGMAEILLARIRGPESFERPVVIKRILGHIATKDVERMFLDEARIVASIRHPNVVQVHELGSEGGELYLAMEYLEGESASSLARRLTLRKERLRYALAAHIAAEICAGLHAAHELRGPNKEPLELVHRDVSPQNLFITYDGDVKLLDFGIAKTIVSSAKTEAGTVKGKIAYLSPEQCRGNPIDRRADLFSLGIVLYELITGKQLFQRSTAMLTMQAISTERVVPLAAIEPDIPTRLSDVCVKALQLQASDRYATAAEMRRDLMAALRELAPDGDLREELGGLMRGLYGDRIEAKERMLQQVRERQSLDAVPEGEADLDVEIPVAVEATVRESDLSEPKTHAGAAVDPRRSVAAPGPRSRTGWVVTGLLVLLFAIVAVLVRLRRATPPADTAVVASMPSSVTTGSVTTGSAEPVPDPPMVGVFLSSVPPGAAIRVDGQPRGTTPASLRLPRSQKAARVELVLGGYATVTQELVPDVDQRLVISLVPQKASAPHPRGRPPASAPTPRPVEPTTAAPVTTAPAPSSGGFTRFD